MEVEALIARYPRLYHMAEVGTWPSIKSNGLLSTSAILDALAISGAQRNALEVRHRPSKVGLQGLGGTIVLRDQKPMEPTRLAQALLDGLSVEDWYQKLNSMVFMWASESRLLGLLNARAYRMLEHDVLTIASKALLHEYSEAVWLCHMNSGNTFPIPHLRGRDAFKRIESYPTRGKLGLPAKEVVEVTVDYGIPNIVDFVVGVRRMKGATVLANLEL